MEAFLLEMQWVKNAYIDKEIFVVENDGKFRIVDFSTGKMNCVYRSEERRVG